eukprot:Gb_35675 [translate_table: standard]
MLATDWFDLKRLGKGYMRIQTFTGKGLFLQELTSQMPVKGKSVEACMFNGNSYKAESKWKRNWLGKMMRKDYRDSELVEKKWKTRKPGEQKSENRTSAPKVTDRNSSTMLDESSKQYEDFRWMHHKGEVLCAVGCFSLFILAVLLIHFATEGFIVAFAIPWILTASLSFSLFAYLFLCYESSQIACRYMSVILFLLVSISWIIDNSFCRDPAYGKLDSTISRQDLQYIDLSLVFSFPCLLSRTLFLPAKGSYFWFIALAFFGIFILATGWSYVTADFIVPQALYIFGITIILTFATLCIGYLGSHPDKQLYATIKALEKSLCELKLNEQEAISASDQNKEEYADKINQMRQFIGFIFHEIRVPFNAVVLGIGHMLAGSLSDEQREILKMMDASSSSMIRILNDVLDMGKIEAGKLQLEKQPFNMGELVSSLIWAFKDTLDSKGIEFSLCVDAATNQVLSHHELIGDKHRVRQVLANYLSNAAKFTPRNGKVRLRVVCNGTYTADAGLIRQLEAFPQNGIEQKCKICYLDQEKEKDLLFKEKQPAFLSVTLCVEDTGIGISKEDQARLFEPYTQIKAGSVQGGGGTGLGLCFSKRIVELSGGTVGVQSEVGKGSTFSFTMPFELAASLPRDRNTENPFDFQKIGGTLARTISLGKFSGSSSIGHKPKVLIVEDNQVNRKILKKLLSSFNVDSEDVEDGKQAVDLCRNGGAYDMILIDKEMPVMDGLEATRELRAMGIKVPIVGLTGNALDSDRNQFLAAGVDDFFTKPISRHQLFRLLEVHGLVIRSKK